MVFNPQMQGHRPGLTLANGNVYIAFASHEDEPPYYGWVMAYSESTLAQTAVYVDTPIGQGWHLERRTGSAVDSAGNLYFTTGNGILARLQITTCRNGQQLREIIAHPQLVDYFTPSNASNLNSGDMDLGSAGIC